MSGKDTIEDKPGGFLTAFTIFFEWLNKTLGNRIEEWQINFLKVTMWLIVIGSFIAIVTKLLIGKPSSIPAYALFIFVMVGSVVAVLLPKLELYIFSRLSEISIGEFKLVLAKAERIRELLGTDNEITPNDLIRDPSDLSGLPGAAVPLDQPFFLPGLEGHQRYQYERYSFVFYQGLRELNDPTRLSAEDRESYRILIKSLGRAALRMKHYTKYKEIVSHLERFTDRPLDAEEAFLIGHAHLWAADEQPERGSKTEYWGKADRFLTRAVKQNPDEVRYIFSLGVVQFSCHAYSAGIESMEKSLRLDPSIGVWANWNIACGLVKLGSKQDALKKLEQIPPGGWWKTIVEDDWFAVANDPEFEEQFKKLCYRKMLTPADKMTGGDLNSDYLDLWPWKIKE